MDGLFVVPNLRIVLKLSSRVKAYFAYSVFRNDEMALHFGKEPSFFVVLMKIYRKTMNVKEIENNEKRKQENQIRKRLLQTSPVYREFRVPQLRPPGGIRQSR